MPHKTVWFPFVSQSKTLFVLPGESLVFAQVLDAKTENNTVAFHNEFTCVLTKQFPIQNWANSSMDFSLPITQFFYEPSKT